MAIADIFTQLITKVESILIDNPVVIPASKNFSKTASTKNQVFNTVNIFDHQIDDQIKGDNLGYEIAPKSCYIEYIPGDAKMLLNNVSSFPDSKVFFHIYSTSLNSQGTGKMEQNLEIYGLRDTLKRYINGYAPTGCTNFMCCEDKLDYKHGNITKYLLGYNFNFIDTVGSLFDVKSPNYKKAVVIPNLTVSVNQWLEWIVGDYVALENVVLFGSSGTGYNTTPNVYLCTISNQDLVFTPANWILIPPWKIQLWAVGNYCYYGGIIWQCNVNNQDNQFIPSNWINITHG